MRLVFFFLTGNSPLSSNGFHGRSSGGVSTVDRHVVVVVFIFVVVFLDESSIWSKSIDNVVIK
jgi:hypothetical protein